MLERTEKILDKKIINKFKQTKVLIIGIGGVGGHALETLVRSGFESITIIDNDIIEESNLNRQIIALNSTIGQDKVKVAVSRAKDINKNINIEYIKEFITKDNLEDHFKTKFDYIIDACDTITTKIELIKYALKNDIKIISCMGTGNRVDPTKLEITNIWKTKNDPLAKVVRKLLKENNITKKIPVVCSLEIPIKTKDRTPGSIANVPSVAGIYCATYIINDIIKSTIKTM